MDYYDVAKSIIRRTANGSLPVERAEAAIVILLEEAVRAGITYGMTKSVPTHEKN